jgi:hypothetical protein
LRKSSLKYDRSTWTEKSKQLPDKAGPVFALFQERLAVPIQMTSELNKLRYSIEVEYIYCVSQVNREDVVSGGICVLGVYAKADILVSSGLY